MTISFIWSSCKCPDVFKWIMTMCQTHSKDIASVNTTSIIKSYRNMFVIDNDLPTYLIVLKSLYTKCVTHTSSWCNITNSFRRGDQAESSGTGLTSVPRVYVGHPHPPSCLIATGSTHTAVHSHRRPRRLFDPVVARRSFKICLVHVLTGFGWFVYGSQQWRWRKMIVQLLLYWLKSCFIVVVSLVSSVLLSVVLMLRSLVSLSSSPATASWTVMLTKSLISWHSHVWRWVETASWSKVRDSRESKNVDSFMVRYAQS